MPEAMKWYKVGSDLDDPACDSALVRLQKKEAAADAGAQKLARILSCLSVLALVLWLVFRFAVTVPAAASLICIIAALVLLVASVFVLSRRLTVRGKRDTWPETSPDPGPNAE